MLASSSATTSTSASSSSTTTTTTNSSTTATAFASFHTTNTTTWFSSIVASALTYLLFDGSRYPTTFTMKVLNRMAQVAGRERQSYSTYDMPGSDDTQTYIYPTTVSPSNSYPEDVFSEAASDSSSFDSYRAYPTLFNTPKSQRTFLIPPTSSSPPETPSLNDSLCTDTSSVLDDEDEDDSVPGERSITENGGGMLMGLGLVGIYQKDGDGDARAFDGMGLLSRGFIGVDAHEHKHDDDYYGRPTEQLFSEVLDTFSPARDVEPFATSAESPDVFRVEPASASSQRRQLRRDVATSTISSNLKCIPKNVKASRGGLGASRNWR